MTTSRTQWLINIIRTRRAAYRALFCPGDKTLSPMAEAVLSDLRSFCRATTTPAVVSQTSGTIDPIATGIAIGRLEVWHRITQNIHLSDADLYKMVENDRSVKQPQFGED